MSNSTIYSNPKKFYNLLFPVVPDIFFHFLIHFTVLAYSFHFQHFAVWKHRVYDLCVMSRAIILSLDIIFWDLGGLFLCFCIAKPHPPCGPRRPWPLKFIILIFRIVHVFNCCLTIVPWSGGHSLLLHTYVRSYRSSLPLQTTGIGTCNGLVFDM